MQRRHERRSLLAGTPVALAATSAFAQGTPQRAEAPAVKAGDTWKHEQRDRRTGNTETVSVRTVTAVSPTLIEGTENQGKFSMTPELNPIESAVSVFSGDPKFLSFPLEVGKRWNTTYSFANKANPTKGRIQLEIEVVGVEKVTVLAGAFEAFRLVSKGFWNLHDQNANGRSRATYWYAPAARTVVTTEHEDGYSNWIRELVEKRLAP